MDAPAKSLHLDEAERGHLFDLARASNTTTRAARHRSRPKIRQSIYRVLDALSVPAYMRNNRMDILAANQMLHRALYRHPQP